MPPEGSLKCLLKSCIDESSLDRGTGLEPKLQLRLLWVGEASNGVTSYTVCSGFMILRNLHAILCGCYDKFPISKRKVRHRFLTFFPFVSLSPLVIVCSFFNCTVFWVLFRSRWFKCLWEEVSEFTLVMKFVDPRDTAISEPWIFFFLDCGPSFASFP